MPRQVAAKACAFRSLQSHEIAFYTFVPASFEYDAGVFKGLDMGIDIEIVLITSHLGCGFCAHRPVIPGQGLCPVDVGDTGAGIGGVDSVTLARLLAGDQTVHGISVFTEIIIDMHDGLPAHQVRFEFSDIGWRPQHFHLQRRRGNGGIEHRRIIVDT